MKRIKIVYIISDIGKAVAFEWIAMAINKEKFLLSFILLNPGDSILEDHLRMHKISVSRVTCRGKKDWLFALLKVYKLLMEIKPDAIHCHLFGANILGLIAGKMARVKKRIYTRHHSSLHHIYFRKGVWWDKLANKLATNIVAISLMVKEILEKWENADPKKIVLIHHGFVLDEYSQVAKAGIDEFKNRAEISGKYPVIGVISRFTEWKGIQYIIPAFRRLLEDHPNAILLLMGAHGDFESAINKLLDTLSLRSYRKFIFEKDIAAVYKSMDVIVHVPIDQHSEAFGQIYIESLAAEVPSIFTLSGIATDFVVDKFNALVVPYKNSNAIYNALIEILINKDLVERIKMNGKKSVYDKFNIDFMINRLEYLYES
ncbi:MAG: hypothetical protein NVS9B7_14520 [Flavisolibacter sp.]